MSGKLYALPFLLQSSAAGPRCSAVFFIVKSINPLAHFQNGIHNILVPFLRQHKSQRPVGALTFCMEAEGNLLGGEGDGYGFVAGGGGAEGDGT